VDEPARNPVACGALGRFDESVLKAVAAALGEDLREVHRDRRSALWLDREPLRWSAGLTRGLAWSERYPAPSADVIGSWQDAGTELDACGLVLGPRRRAVHASVSGAASVYWAERDGALYFATRIDALAWALGERLDVDWETWSSIFTLRQPIGERTPFRQIRRLPQLSMVAVGPGGAVVERAPWPWAEVEPNGNLEGAVDALVEAVHDTLLPLRSTGAAVLLSGGLDSRAMLGLADDAGVPVRALTAVADDGLGWEADLAGAAAAASGIEQERFAPADGAEYRRLWVEHLEALDFQFLMGSFVMPMGPRLEELGMPALDGLALDVLGVPGGRFYRDPRMLDPTPDYDFRGPLFESMRARAMPNVPERALAKPYARAMVRSARRQFRQATSPYREHRSQALLSVYSMRTVRGVAMVPMQLMGRHARVITPCAHDRAARALLAADPREKIGRRFYHELFARIASPSARLPTVEDATRPPAAEGPRLRFADEMVALYDRGLREGPLAPHLGKALSEHVRAGTVHEAIRRTSKHRAAMVLTVFQLWAERYQSVLREIDPSGLLEGT
jgi:hypothetical protein